MQQGGVRRLLLGVIALGLCGCLATLQGSRVAAPAPYDQNSNANDLLTPQLLGIGFNMSTP
jgi:hypothetical protein